MTQPADGSIEARFSRGIEYLTQTQGQKVADRIEADLRNTSNSYADFSISSTYGDVFTRPGLDTRSRVLATITILATIGGCEPQLKLHIRSALRMGATGDEIVELIIQIAAYAGAPRASNAFLAAREVFEREGVTVK